jgi:hypothetical protein
MNCDLYIEESNSLWLEFEIGFDGTLIFTISPEVPHDDLDFILFRKSDDCQSLEEIRCMQSGISYGTDPRVSSRCSGKTGLDNMSIDEFELSGCKYNDDNSDMPYREIIYPI